VTCTVSARVEPANIECVFEVESETLKTIADLPLRRKSAKAR
jgi:hypothetical protein